MRDKPNIESMYYLSPVQQGLLFHRIAEADEDPYFYQYVYSLRGSVHLDAFERAWQLAVERHPILRTAFIWEGVDKPVQVVRRQASLPIERHDWREVPAEEHSRTLQALLDRDRSLGWDFIVPPLMRLHLIRIAAEEWLFINSHHHILLDGWSMALVLRDVLVAYDATVQGRSLALRAPRPYRDYIAWLNRQDMQQAESYWREALKGFSTATALSIEPPQGREEEDSLPFAEQSLRISSERTADLQSFSRRLRITMNTMIQGAWALVLSRYSGTSDVLFGATVSGRPSDLAGVADMVGLFINTVPIRVALNPAIALSAWLRAVQEQNSVVRQYEWTPLANIQRWSDLPAGRPLFDSLVVFESYPEIEEGSLPQALTVEPVSLHRSEGHTLTTGRNNYPLSLMVEPGRETRLIVSYAHRRFAHPAMSRLLRHLDSMLDSMKAEPERRLRDLSLLPEVERLQLKAWNRSDSPPPAFEVCVHELIEAQASEQPEAHAVVTETDRLSYRELDRRANRLAQYLQERGVGPEKRVAICLERSLDLVIALLAVLKAGGAYVPLDPGFPKERLAYMVADSGAVIVLSHSSQAEALSGFGDNLVLLDRDIRMIARRDDHRPSTKVTPQNLAYVIYTSGSTGRPKGVAVEHRQIVQYVCTVMDRLALPAGAGMAAVSTVAADLGNTALFGALCTGRPLHLLSSDHGFDPDAMAAYMHGHAVDVLKIVPSHLSGLLSAEHPERVLPRRCLILGGEAFRPDLIERVRALAPSCAIVNHYGPTETTVGVLTHRLEGVSSGAPGVPIGRPLPFTQIYVLDYDGQQTPIGMPGELYIGGGNVTRGYLGRPDSTAERFLPDVFGGEAGSRLYRTGDRVRLRPDGAMEFLGRVDSQVKVRGFRIELGEIDSHLRQEPSIAEAVTVVHETEDGAQQLVAYVVGDSPIDTAALRTRLASRLPDYMVPQAIVVLDSLPLTANGKLDRTALPDPQHQPASVGEAHYVAPRNPVESILASVWADVLRVEQVGVHDNFFALGGDSIRTLQVIARANQQGVKLTPKQLFEHQTVATAASVAHWKDGPIPAESIPIPVPSEPEGLPVDRRPSSESIEPSVSQGTEQSLPVFPLSGVEPERLLQLRDDWDGIEDCYPLSPMQEGMLFHTLMNPGSGMYLMQQHYVWEGRMDRDAFGRAWQRVIDRHPILRTSFMWKDLDRPLQLVHRRVKAGDVIEDLDWSHVSEDEQRLQMTKALEQELADGLAFTTAPLMRIRLVRQGAERCTIVRSFHHILTDDWCFSLLMMDFMAHYEAFVEGLDLTVTSPPPYREYIAWLQRQDLGVAQQFWTKELAGFTTPTPLGIERVERNTPVTESSVGDVYMELSPEVSEKLRLLAQTHQLTPNTFVQGAWTLLLSRYSGEKDVLFGVTVAGRPTDLPGVEAIMGLFINTLPLRVTVPPQASLMSWLKDLLAANYRIRQYEYAPLVQIQQWSEVPPGQALFKSLLVFENAPKDPRLGEDRHDRVVSYEHDRVHTNYPVTVVGYPGDTMGVRLSYDRKLMEHDAVDRMLGHLKTLLEGMAAVPHAKLHELPMVGEAERRRVLTDWNDTDRADDIDGQFPALFEAQVARTPEAIAAQSGSHTLSYADLNRVGNRIAHALRALSAGPDTIVALLDERGLAFLSMIVGVLKVGGAYVPLDLHHPVERLAHVISASRARIVVTRDGHAGLLAQVIALLPKERQPNVLSVEQMAMENWPEENPRPIEVQNHLAYVIYTSGSTGFPKGAMVDCKGMLNHLTSKVPTLRLGRADVVAQTASQCFDISVWQFLTPLLCGARVQIVADDVVRDPQRLLQEIADRNVTVLEVVPSLLSTMLECSTLALPHLRWLLPTGEALSPELCRKWFSRYPNIPLVNAYGPAECSDDVAIARIEQIPDEDVTRMPIGRPIDRVCLYVVDRDLEPVPAGVAGELCVGGVAVGRGYVHDPTRTAEVFVPDPFCLESGGRLYRTGDLARHRTDGMIEFVGRRDHQVKIRGFRIELGEIEARLSQHPDVARSVVMAREDQPGRRQLVAYVVPVQALTVEAIRTFIKQVLPDYMVPAVVFLADLPLTPNGKIDRKALPALDADRTDERVEAPSTPTQDLVAGIWSEILRTERIGKYDQFFDLGGHSLLATQVISRVRVTFQAELPLRSLFDYPTVEGFAAAIDRAATQDTGLPAPPIMPVTRTERLPLSFAQQRLWFLAQMDPASGAYNLPFALKLQGTLNCAVLERSFKELVRRHETLRTTFPSLDGEPGQIIVAAERFAFVTEDLTEVPGEERAASIMHRVEEEAHRPFVLERDLPIRARLLRVQDDEHILLVTVHHIAADAWSLAVVTNEVAVLYRALAGALTQSVDGSSMSLEHILPELPVQYSDFSFWQRQWLQGAVLEQEVGYWKQRLGANPPQLALRTDHPRPEIHTYRGGRHTFLIPKEVAGALRTLSRRQGATMFMTLLSVFNVLLSRATGQTDILVGTDVANRNRHETEHLIGFFVNLLPLRTDVSGNPSFVELLRRVREVALGAYAHQDLPFEKIVEALKLSRDLSRNPLVQVLFVLQNVPPPSLQLPDLNVESLEFEHEVSRFDLGLFMEETEDGLSGLWKFSRDLFEPETIAGMARNFVTLLGEIVAAPDRGIDQLDMLSEEEKEARTMETKQREEGKLQRFKSIKPKAVILSQRTLVTSRPLSPDRSLPLVFTPAVDDVDLIDWAKENRSLLQRDLLKFGALLFRGFTARTVSDFESVAQAVCPELFGEYGDLPREKSGRHVYGSTPYPPDKAILFHNESSHMHRWPQKQFFFCVQAAPEGGETPIVDCRAMYQVLRPYIREELQSKQLMYVRNFTPGVDVSWQDFFRTSDKAVVEEMCVRNGMECMWMEKDSLRTRQICPAVVEHPKTGEWVFFNQIQLHHVSCLEQAVRESLLSMLGMESIPRNVYFGDGSPIDDAIVAEIGELYERTAVRFRWQEGDLLMLDNMLVAHARDPFTGPRKIVVAMGDMISHATLQSVSL